jgi:hypothetical protein
VSLSGTRCSHPSLVHRRSLALVGVLLLASGVVVAQSPQDAEVPRTSWGAPDLQGVWDFRTLTPLERPRDLAGQATFTEEEAAAFERRAIESRASDGVRDRSVHAYWWLDFGTEVNEDRRTALINDPQDGRIPPLTVAAQESVRAPRQHPITQPLVLETGADGPEDRGVAARCIIGFSSGPPIVPSAYNNILQVFQTPDHVVILTEMVHDARIVPVDGRPHLAKTVRQWLGDSRGHWDGETLVVETTNLTDKASFSGNLTAKGASGETYHVVERFTRVSADRLVYEFTVEDPTWWTRPWTAAIPMKRTAQQVYEYACHEGNYGMSNILSGSRVEDQASEEAAVR